MCPKPLQHYKPLGGGILRPVTKLAIAKATKRNRKIKNRIFAIPDAVAAIPVKPKTAAIIAMIKNVMAQLNIRTPFLKTT